MSTFRDILGDPESDLYGDPNAVGPADNNDIGMGSGDPDAEREALRTEIPEAAGHTVTGFVSNFAKDVGAFGGGMFSILANTAVHPQATAEAVGGALLDPIETGKQLAAPLIEKYTPQPDESIVGMLARNAYDHPFDTLMDASTIIQGPFSAGAKAAEMAGAVNTANKLRTVAEYGKAIDPISLAQATGTFALKTVAPDALARIRMGEATADAASQAATREKYLVNEMNQRLLDAEKDLTPAEKAIRFAYGEGRIQLNPEADQITELTHRGEWEKRAVENGSAIRPEALDAWAEQWRGIQADYETAAGIDPETYAQRNADAALRHRSHMPDGAENPSFNPMDPENQQAYDTAYQNGLNEAQERKLRRSTLSVRTALDIQKETAFRTKAAQLGVDQATFDAQEIHSMLPKAMPTSLDEALEVMGPKAGIIIPHSMEVLTQEQATIGNVLTKLGESSVYKDNLASRFAAGELEHLDPAQALSRYYQSAIRGKTFSDIGRDAAELSIKNGWGYAENMTGKKWNINHDPDVIAGTHQPFHPASLALNGMVQEKFDAVASRLLEAAAGGDEGAKTANLANLAEGMSGAAEKTYPWTKSAADEVYKVTTAFGHELANYQKSFTPATNPLEQISDKLVMGPFNMVNLNLKVGRFLNNFYGNSEFVTMQGLHPFTARGMMGLMTAGRAILGKWGVLNDEVSKNLAEVFNLPGVHSGGLSASEAFSKVNDLTGRIAEGTSVRALNNPVGRFVGRWGQMMSKANQDMESIFRGASTIYEMTPGGMAAARNLVHGSAAMADMSENIARLRGMGVEAMSDEGLKSAVTGMNRWLHNYDRTTSFDRTVARYVFPYYKFYRHSAELLMRYPFEKPLQAQLVRAVGDRALQDIKDQAASMGFDWNTMVPESMRYSVPLKVALGPEGVPDTLVTLNTQGPNPFSFLSSGDPGKQALAALHPLAKIAIEQATGVNLFTGEKFQGALSTFNGRTVDENGAIVEDHTRPNLAEHYLRQFFPYQMAEDFIKNGRMATDSSDLTDMLRNAPGTFQRDDRGLEKRRAEPFGPLTSLGKFIGVTAGVHQAPTAKQTAAQNASISAEFNKLLEQHPERREEIMRKWDDAIANAKEPAVRLKVGGERD